MKYLLKNVLIKQTDYTTHSLHYFQSLFIA
jgi:hypothetical protein